MQDDRMDKIKDKIRKLLAIAADDKVADGEIAAAMKLAEAALEKYHLDRADVEASAPENGTPKPEVMGQVKSSPLGPRFTIWEQTLCSAVMELVGSVGCFHNKQMAPKGTFRKPTLSAVVTWYGPAEDAKLASELFDEWGSVIATIAIGRFGGCANKEGARYAYGFAHSLYEKASRAAFNRTKLITASTTAIVKVGEGSLAMVLAAKRERSNTWLAESEGIKLGNGRRSAGYSWSKQDRDAYAEGRSDGDRAEFQAKRTAKLEAK